MPRVLCRVMVVLGCLVGGAWAEVAPTNDLPTDPAAVAREYLATGDIAVFNRIFRVSRSARAPALEVLLPVLKPESDRTTLERSFSLLRALDDRRPEVIAALRRFLEPGQPLGGHAMFAIDALGNDGEVLIDDLIRRLPGSAYALSQIGRRGDLVVPALLRALRDRDGRAHWGVVTALGNPAWTMQADQIVPELVRILGEPDPPVEWNSFTAPDAQSVRGRAAYALHAFGWRAESAVPALIAGLQEENRYAAYGMLDTLASLRPVSAAAVPRLIEIIRAIPPEPDRTERDGKVVVARLTDRKNGMAAISTLRALGVLASAATPALTDLALGDDSRLASLAIETLEIIGHLSAQDAKRLLAAGERLSGRESERYFSALRGPGGAGLETALSRWAAADEALRSALERAFWITPVPVAETPGLRELTRHADPLVRRKTIDLLAHGRPCPAWVIEAIAELFVSPDPGDREVALGHLTVSPSRCVAFLPELIHLTTDSRTAMPAGWAIAAASPLGEADIARLRPLLDDPAHHRQVPAARALVGVLTPDERTAATACVLAALTAKNNGWWQTAIDYLMAIPADPSIVGDLRQRLDQVEEPRRSWLLPALVHHLPPAEAVDLLITLLDARRQEWMACKLLATLGPEARRALPQLQALAWAPEGECRSIAWCAIVVLDGDDQGAIGRVASIARSGFWVASPAHDRDERVMAFTALTRHPHRVPALHRLGELFAGHPDAAVAAAARASAERHR